MNMNKSQFAERIKSFDFSTLFNELGWDRFEDKLHPVTIDKTAYPLTGIAQKRGFVIVQCGAGADGRIPSSQVRSKIEHVFARHYQEHIIIFVNDSHTEQKWQYIIPEENRPRRIRCADYRKGQAPELLYQKMKNLVFSIDEEENISLIDVLKRVNENFAKNTEQVTKKFYDSFKKYHTAFMAFISGIDDAVPDKTNSNKQWYTSLMMNRLMFCYFIQKKGFLDGNINYLSDKLHECQEMHGKDRFFSFYRQFLLVLFHDNLGTPKEKRPDGFEVKFGKIPYLNGGLFDVHELERKYDDIQINDKAFQDIFAFFDEWQWHLDTSDHGDGRHINPDVIGYIFEKYINDRAEMGAYYTKEDITNYIGQNCILPFLFDKTAKTCPPVLKPDGFVWTYLKDSGDTYIYDAVKHGVPEADGDLHAGLPEDVLQGFDDELAQKIVSDETEVHLWQKRQCWNRKVNDCDIALPTETWRELIARRERCAELRQKIASGAISQINDFITYNLNIRQFTQDVVENCPDPAFIKEFYKALKSVTVLDPTCGSGAFLFAALNILEPLYAACIRRMEDFVAEAKPGHFKFFEEELAEVNNEKHPNQEYFIYKSIILHNLYGVDIMKEAVEIAKLRLFLKLVATVDVNRRKANMGLEPLPDIDFNIRAGNTLVGFATEQELMDGLSGDFFAQQRMDEFKEKTALVAQAFKRFQDAQLIRQPYHEAKADYKRRLNELNEELNLHLSQSYGVEPAKKAAYAKWKESHRPFHWFTEFYEIVVNNGGFDVIIGNPPYVAMSKIKYIKREDQFECSDLYGYVIKRVLQILSSTGMHGFIVMHNLAFSKNFADVRSELFKHAKYLWCSFYARIPAGLFSGDVRVRNCIYILQPGSRILCSYTTKIHRWFSSDRDNLFFKLRYSNFGAKTPIPMTPSEKLLAVFDRPLTEGLRILENRIGKYQLSFKQNAYNWIAVSIDPAPCWENSKKIEQTQTQSIFFNTQEERDVILLLLGGKIFFSYWLTFGDEFHVTKNDLLSFCFPFKLLSREDKLKLLNLAKKFVDRLEETIQYKLNAGKRVGTYNTSKLWSITDSADRIFLKYIATEPQIIQNEIENHVLSTVLTEEDD